MHWMLHLTGVLQRVNHAAVSLGHIIYSFGGYSSIEGHNSDGQIDVHIFDTEMLRWYPVEYGFEADVHAVPFKRYGHTVVEYKRKIYLWGGRNDKFSSAVLHCFDTRTMKWSLPTVTGQSPFPADGHTACVIGEFMYVFGGYEEYNEKFSDVLYRLNLETMVWETVHAKGLMPMATDFHTASAIGDRMYIFGGRGITMADGHRLECYNTPITYLDTKRMIWVQPHTSGDPPCQRRSHSSVAYKGMLYIFCGYNSITYKHYGDMHRFNPEANEWSFVKCPGEWPSPRRRQCCCLVGSRMYLFGGTSPSAECDEDEDEDEATNLRTFDDFHRLSDQSDLLILDFEPSLKSLCLLKIVELDLDYRILPRLLQSEAHVIQKQTAANKLYEYPRHDFGFVFSA